MGQKHTKLLSNTIHHNNNRRIVIKYLLSLSPSYIMFTSFTDHKTLLHSTSFFASYTYSMELNTHIQNSRHREHLENYKILVHGVINGP